MPARKLMLMVPALRIGPELMMIALIPLSVMMPETLMVPPDLLSMVPELKKADLMTILP